MKFFLRIFSLLNIRIIIGVSIFAGCFALGDTFPLLWIFQQPTDLIEEGTASLAEYTCDTAQTQCRVNFDFTPSLPREEPASHYSCVIDFGFGATGEENKCNPNTVIFPLGDHRVHLAVTHIESATVVKDGEIVIHNSAGGGVGEGGGGGNEIPVYTASIKWQSSSQLLLKENTALSEYACNPEAGSCQINLLVTPQKNGQDDTSLTCLVTADFDLGIGADPCNPLPSTVHAGEHTITLQIVQKSDSSVVVTRSIVLKNPLIDTSIDPLRVTSTFAWQSPTDLLFKEDIGLTEYACDPDAPGCRINLLFTPLLDGVESSLLTCEIISDFPLEPTTDPCNPNTSVVPIGNHILTIKILQKSDNVLLTTREITLKNPLVDMSIDPLRVTSTFAWQSPTYLLLKEDTSLTEYTCDISQPECKLNLFVMPLLDGAESSQLTCEITSDFLLVPTTDPCNPNTSIVPPGDHMLSIKVLSKIDNSLLLTREILLKNSPAIAVGGYSNGGRSGGGSVSSMDLSSVQMVIQSGLDANGRCRSDICQVNFLAEAPTNALCIWDFGAGVFETVGTNTKCNPGYVKFPSDTTVRLTVSYPVSAGNSITKTLQISHGKPTTVLGYPQAVIDMQGVIGKNKRLTGSGITCEIGNDESCSLNVTGEKSLNAKTYFWNLGNGHTSEQENPGAEKYPLGHHRITLRIMSDSGVSSEIEYYIDVVKKFDILPDEECLDCEKMRGKLQISSVLPNPPHSDTVEWIEIKNISSETYSLDACTLSDETKTYELYGSISAGNVLRFRQLHTGITLGNSHEILELHCGEFLIDSFSWDFAIPSGYILRREMLKNSPEQVTVLRAIDGDTVEVMLNGKKTRVRLLGVDTPETVHPRKEVEKFGKEASDFTKKTLTGKTVWISFDYEPVDHYGRTLGYIWQCESSFDTEQCELFNARLITEGYARMERRFEFMYYESFDDLEKEARKNKVGIWSDVVMVEVLNDLSAEEKDILAKEQEEEYLRLQRELLELAKKGCEEGGVCEDMPKWSDITEKMTTLSVRALMNGILKISGRTWGDFLVKIRIFSSGQEIYSSQVRSSVIGEYEVEWYPKTVGDYRIEVVFEKSAEGEGIVTMEKNILVENISDHFLAPLAGKIIVQGKMSKNRWFDESGVFQCRSRSSCSVNLEAGYNRKNDMKYEWILPDGSLFSDKNPPSFKIPYGDFSVKLSISDSITGEHTEDILRIHHSTIPKSAKKPSSISSKYTLDLKDATADIGGGYVTEGSMSLPQSLLAIFVLGILSLVFFGKKKNE